MNNIKQSSEQWYINNTYVISSYFSLSPRCPLGVEFLKFIWGHFQIGEEKKADHRLKMFQHSTCLRVFCKSSLLQELPLSLTHNLEMGVLAGVLQPGLLSPRPPATPKGMRSGRELSGCLQTEMLCYQNLLGEEITQLDKATAEIKLWTSRFIWGSRYTTCSSLITWDGCHCLPRAKREIEAKRHANESVLWFSRGWEVLPDLSVVNRLRVGQSRAGSWRAHVFTWVRGSAWRPPPSSDGVFPSLRRDEAEMEYLKIAQDLEMYGVNYFTIRVCGSPCEFPGRRGRRSQGQTARTGPSWSQGADTWPARWPTREEAGKRVRAPPFLFRAFN